MVRWLISSARDLSLSARTSKPGARDPNHSILASRGQKTPSQETPDPRVCQDKSIDGCQISNANCKYAHGIYLHNLCKNKRVIFISHPPPFKASTYLGLFPGPRVPLVLFPFLRFNGTAAVRFHLNSSERSPSSRYLCGHMVAAPPTSSSSSSASHPHSPYPSNRRLTLNNSAQSQSWCAILKLSVTFVSDDARRRANKIWYRTDSIQLVGAIQNCIYEWVRHNQSWTNAFMIHLGVSAERCDWSTDGWLSWWSSFNRFTK